MRDAKRDVFEQARRHNTPASSSCSPSSRQPRSRGSFIRQPPPKKVSIAGKEFRVSPVLDTFFWFVTERHRVHQRRLAGERQPWTTDEILSTYPFANVFRVYDRTTQYILRHVIMEGSQELNEMCFRVILFRTFCRIETWELLKRRLGNITWKSFNLKVYEEIVLSETAAVYGPAYIMPAPKLGATANAANHLRLIELMMKEKVPSRLKQFVYLRDAHGYLRLFPSMGDFIALQLLLDLNMTPHFRWDENTWAALGPGALMCIKKIFGPDIRGREYEAFKYLHESQDYHFLRLRISPRQRPRLSDTIPAGLTMVDMEHALCETEKYSRARHPNISGKKIKVARREYVPRSPPPTAILPQHWLAPGGIRRPTLRCPPPVNPHTDDPNPEYEVSHIVAEKPHYTEGPKHYLVRWAGYGPNDDIWLRECDLIEGASDALSKWQTMKARISERVAEYQATGDCEASSRTSSMKQGNNRTTSKKQSNIVIDLCGSDTE
ncbi:hypothetical protein CERSUDRAFT_151547 [Gelatoporia subvermispora B]|uniref:Chromo domain-containing protein n=1 Tax=Ceriporiopsis subvermispora (strain B) TaxID=914234 RepID=M2PQL6_CERS8|nr:hypothetical protein CERSUDRAFT_151547 [Gelatoporia subvermispora B]